MHQRFVFIVLLAIIFVGCERPKPNYVLKTEVGEASYVHFDDMKEQPKYIKMRKTPAERRKAIQQRREERERSKGVYRRKNRWDF
jgi:hypothetical protein